MTKTDVPIAWLSSDGCGCPADSSESARVVSAAHVSSWWHDVDGDVSGADLGEHRGEAGDVWGGTCVLLKFLLKPCS